MATILNLSTHGDMALNIRRFWAACGVDCADFDCAPKGIPNERDRKAASDHAALHLPMFVASWKHYMWALPSIPNLNQARLAAVACEAGNVYGDFRFLISCSDEAAKYGRRLLLMPKSYGLTPDDSPRDIKRVSSFIHSYDRFGGREEFLQLKEMLAADGIETTTYGAPDNALDWVIGEDVAMMRKSIAVVHFKSTDATANAVCKSIAVGTPVFMLRKYHAVGGYNNTLGVVCRDTVDEIRQEIIKHVAAPEPLLKDTAVASSVNQEITPAKIEEARAWFAAIMSEPK